MIWTRSEQDSNQVRRHNDEVTLRQPQNEWEILLADSFGSSFVFEQFGHEFVRFRRFRWTWNNNNGVWWVNINSLSMIVATALVLKLTLFSIMCAAKRRAFWIDSKKIKIYEFSAELAIKFAWISVRRHWKRLRIAGLKKAIIFEPFNFSPPVYRTRHLSMKYDSQKYFYDWKRKSFSFRKILPLEERSSLGTNARWLSSVDLRALFVTKTTARAAPSLCQPITSINVEKVSETNAET